MRFVDEFRDGAKARALAAAIAQAAAPGRTYRIMEFCGGHTHTIARFGLEDLLPEGIRMVHGPGCPVCVLPVARLDMAIDLAARPSVILATYADLMRVPGSGGRSLFRARAEGADIRMVYSPTEALALARGHRDREVVFLAVGFETTTPPTALLVKQAAAEGLSNLSVLCNHVLTPAAMDAVVDSPDLAIDAIVGPGHVSTVIGLAPYRRFAEAHGLPVVVAGFEPLDLLQAIAMLVDRLNDGRATVANQYSRALTEDGNPRARAVMAEVFTRRADFEWRGLGRLPDSALALAEPWAAFDAERRFDLTETPAADHKACACADIVRGIKAPRDCKLFARACTPDTPLGACMVSNEGACAAQYVYRRFSDVA